MLKRTVCTFFQVQNHRNLQVVDFIGDGCIDYDPSDPTWTTHPFNDDSTFLDVPLGFPFTYGGVTRTNVDINSNGHLIFDSSATSGRFSFDGNFVGSTEPVIAPYWADVNVNVNGNIRYKQAGDNLLYSGRKLPHLEGARPLLIPFRLCFRLTPLLTAKSAYATMTWNGQQVVISVSVRRSLRVC